MDNFIPCAVLTVVILFLLIPWDVYGGFHSHDNYRMFQSYMASTGHILWVLLQIALIMALSHYSPSNHAPHQFFNDSKRYINTCIFALLSSPLLASIAYNLQTYAGQEHESIFGWISVAILAVFMFPTILYFLILTVLNKYIYIICLTMISICNWIIASYLDPIEHNDTFGIPFHIILPCSTLCTLCICSFYVTFKRNADKFTIKCAQITVMTCVIIYCISFCIGLYSAWINIYHFIPSIAGIFYCIFCSYLCFVFNAFIIFQICDGELGSEVNDEFDDGFVIIKQMETLRRSSSVGNFTQSMSNLFDVDSMYDTERVGQVGVSHICI